MIEDPPILKIRRRFSRPTARELAAFAGATTGNVVDSMEGWGALAPQIKPLEPPAEPIVGTALTCHCGPGDNLGLFGTFDVARPGDIAIAACNGFTDAAVIGDLMAGMMKNARYGALVTDGSVRDVAGIGATGLPVYCAGVTPNSPVRNGPGTVGLAVDIGGVRIESGDIVVCDADGVVIVPRDRIAAAAAQLAAVAAAEAGLEAKVRDGLVIPDFIRTVLDSDRKIEVD